MTDNVPEVAQYGTARYVRKKGMADGVRAWMLGYFRDPLAVYIEKYLENNLFLYADVRDVGLIADYVSRAERSKRKQKPNGSRPAQRFSLGYRHGS